MDEAFAHMESPGKSKRKNMEPPDGGWGYLVCVGTGLTFMLGFGASSAFGILFNDFFTRQEGASGLTIVIGVYNGALSFSGFLSGIALKNYSFRRIGLIGAALFIIGDFLTIFVEKTIHLVIAFGVIRGTGFGMMIPVSYTSFQSYFTKKRIAMMSANQAMSSLASISFPALVIILLEEYGFKWTLALIMAVDLHLLLAMLVMHPVEWHMKEIDPKLSKESKPTEVIATKKNELAKVQAPVSANKKELPKSLKQYISENIDIDLLRNPRFLVILVGIGFVFVSDVTYLALEPMLLYSYKFTSYEVAKCVMIGAVADLIARLSLALFTYFIVVDSRMLFFAGTFATIFLRIGLVLTSDLTAIYIITAVSGVVRCTVQVLFPLVIAAAVPDKFSGALALHILLTGVMMLVADPLIGVIYDVTGSYVPCFLAMSFCCAICIIMWTIEYIVLKLKS